MAGSISKKFRGVCARFWAHLELVLNKATPRVEYEETEGLFSKNARAGPRVLNLERSGGYALKTGPLCK